MQVEQILNPDLTFFNLEGSSKKRVLEQVSQQVSQVIPSIDATALFEGLLAREKLGSTGFGDGVAIPHCRIDNCSTAIGVLVKLKEAVDFDAIDGKPVDILFVLLAPQDANQEHLDTLSEVAELLNQPQFRKLVRASENQEALYDAAMHFMSKSPAA